MIKVVNLKIEGMHCGSCINRIDRAARLAGAKDVDVNLPRRFGRLTYDDDTTDAEVLRQAIAEAGYDVTKLGVFDQDE